MAHSSKPSVLLVGEDRHLLNTRAALLGRLGTEVNCVTGAEALQRIAAQNLHFDLVVLCHSVKQSHAAAISGAVHKRKLPTFVLQVKERFGTDEDRAQICCDALVDAHPASLTDCVRDILRKQAARVQCA